MYKKLPLCGGNVFNEKSADASFYSYTEWESKMHQVQNERHYIFLFSGHYCLLKTYCIDDVIDETHPDIMLFSHLARKLPSCLMSG